MKRFFDTDARPDLADEVLSRISELYPEEDTSALEVGHVAAMVTVAAEAVAAADVADTVAARSAAPSPALTAATVRRRPSLLAGMAAHKWASAAALSLSLLVAFGGAAYAGVLPSPVQRATSDFADRLGVHVPQVSILDGGTQLNQKDASGEDSDTDSAGGGSRGAAGSGAGARVRVGANSANATATAAGGGGIASSATSVTAGISGAASVAATAAPGADKGTSGTKKHANSSAGSKAGSSAGSSEGSSTASATKKKTKKKAKKAKKPRKRKQTPQSARVIRDDSGDGSTQAEKRRSKKRQKSVLLDSGVGGSKETSGTT